MRSPPAAAAPASPYEEMKPLLESHDDPMTVLVAREIEAVFDADIVGWANCHTAPPSYSENADFVQLARSNPRNATNLKNAQSHLKSLIARTFPVFDDKSHEAREIARKLFLKRIRAYLEDDSDPSELCHMVPFIEYKYDFPAWLGNLYDCCDGLPGNTTRQQALDLRRAIEQILAENAELPSFRSE